MKLPSKKLERKLLKTDYRYLIAVDEVGMGCLAGPVVVCAARFDREFFRKSHQALHWLRDSKLLSFTQRQQFAQKLLNTMGLDYRICYAYPKTIDRLNIYQAARQAMKRAVTSLSQLQSVVLVDGPAKIPGLDLPQFPVVKGDRKIFAIACASILAKVYRDRMMARYAKKFPGYGFEQHKGYGTKLHRLQLTRQGPTPIHRRSFAPVNELL